jgi:hypothetical protein
MSEGAFWVLLFLLGGLWLVIVYPIILIRRAWKYSKRRKWAYYAGVVCWWLMWIPELVLVNQPQRLPANDPVGAMQRLLAFPFLSCTLLELGTYKKPPPSEERPGQPC